MSKQRLRSDARFPTPTQGTAYSEYSPRQEGRQLIDLSKGPARARIIPETNKRSSRIDSVERPTDTCPRALPPVLMGPSSKPEVPVQATLSASCSIHEASNWRSSFLSCELRPAYSSQGLRQEFLEKAPPSICRHTTPGT